MFVLLVRLSLVTAEGRACFGIDYSCRVDACNVNQRFLVFCSWDRTAVLSVSYRRAPDYILISGSKMCFDNLIYAFTCCVSSDRPFYTRVRRRDRNVKTKPHSDGVENKRFRFFFLVLRIGRVRRTRDFCNNARATGVIRIHICRGRLVSFWISSLLKSKTTLLSLKTTNLFIVFIVVLLKREFSKIAKTETRRASRMTRYYHQSRSTVV